MLLRQMMRFGVVGGVGFIVDGGMLWFLLANGFSPYVARALSFPVAVIVTWALNRAWTFGAARKSGRIRQFNRYLAIQLIGAATNYCFYSLVVRTFGETSLAIFVGFVFGSFVGMFVNFWGARQIAFRHDA